LVVLAILLDRIMPDINILRFDGIRYGRRAGTGASAKDTMTKTRAEGFGPEVRPSIAIFFADICEVLSFAFRYENVSY